MSGGRGGETDVGFAGLEEVFEGARVCVFGRDGDGRGDSGEGTVDGCGLEFCGRWWCGAVGYGGRGGVGECFWD